MSGEIPAMAVKKKGGGISKEVEDLLRARSAAFQGGTQRKGMPMTYGSGKKPEK